MCVFDAFIVNLEINFFFVDIEELLSNFCHDFIDLMSNNRNFFICAILYKMLED